RSSTVVSARSRSSRSWLTTSAMRSPPETNRSSAPNSLPRARVSRLLVGSSSSSTRGCPRSRPASAASVRSPPDSAATVLSRSVGRPSSPSCAIVRSVTDQSGARPELVGEGAVGGGVGEQLRQVADRRGPGGRTTDTDRSTRGPQLAGDQPEKCALAGAVAADQRGQAGTDREVESGEQWGVVGKRVRDVRQDKGRQGCSREVADGPGLT